MSLIKDTSQKIKIKPRLIDLKYLLSISNDSDKVLLGELIPDCINFIYKDNTIENITEDKIKCDLNINTLINMNNVELTKGNIHFIGKCKILYGIITGGTLNTDELGEKYPQLYFTDANKIKILEEIVARNKL